MRFFAGANRPVVVEISELADGQEVVGGQDWILNQSVPLRNPRPGHRRAGKGGVPSLGSYSVGPLGSALSSAR